MKVVQVRRTGAPEAMSVEETAEPQPGPGEVVIAVELAGVLYGDVLLRSGAYPWPLPYVPGLEVGGHVVALGPEADPALLGTRVVATTVGNAGGYAERATSRAADVFPVPAGLALDHAVAVFQAGAVAVGLLSAMRVPEPGRKEVLVRVRATSVNPSEALVRAGKMRLLSGFRFPKGTGQDFAGEIAAVGPGADTAMVGQQVWGTRLGLNTAAAAEYLSVPVRLVAAAPAGLALLEAAALPTVGLTALMALRATRVGPGRAVLVVGASGGVGSATVQLARAAGAEITTVSSPANTDFCTERGAHKAYAYTQPDALGTASFDAVIDLHGKGLPQYRRRVRRGGRMLSLSPRAMAYALGTILLPGPLVRLAQLKPTTADLDRLASHLATGELRAVVDHMYPLANIAAAHRDQETGHSRGKRVIRVED